MMAIVPPKTYRLADGTLGTEWQALDELVRGWEARVRNLEERIEITRRRMATAPGAPTR